jgi:hypothetical protein
LSAQPPLLPIVTHSQRHLLGKFLLCAKDGGKPSWLRSGTKNVAMGELTSAGLAGRNRSRKRLMDGNGATICHPAGAPIATPQSRHTKIVSGRRGSSRGAPPECQMKDFNLCRRLVILKCAVSN